MRYLLSLAVALTLITSAFSQTPSAAVTVIRAGVLIDGKSNQPRRDQVIVIRGNRIESVSDAASAKVPAGATTIDLSHATVLPGLIDSHTHIFLQGEDPAQGGYDANILRYPLSLRAARATVAARRALEQGFTTLRDLETEGAGYGDVGIKMAIEGGYIPGPRLFVVTRAISTTGGYNLDGYAPELDMPKGAQIIDGPVEARKAAREQLDHGADWIKVYMTHRSWVGKTASWFHSQHLPWKNSRRSLMRPMAGERKWPATHITESACNALWMAGAIRSSMAWKLPMRRFRRW